MRILAEAGNWFILLFREKYLFMDIEHAFYSHILETKELQKSWTTESNHFMQLFIAFLCFISDSYQLNISNIMLF